MANRDINLFKAAGGERAKSGKRSPMAYMTIFALVVIVLAIGVLVYFNMKANAAVKDYDDKLEIQDNYAATKIYVKATSEEYIKVRKEIQAAAAINEYSEAVSALYPRATADELAAVKDAILNNTIGESFSFNDPEEGEPFTPLDYEALRESLYEDSAEEISERELFYFGLQKLSAEQKKDLKKNLWYTYYRGYLLIVFTGGDGMGLPMLVDSLISGTGSMDGVAPFSKFEMQNDEFSDGYYTSAKYLSKVYESETYNIMLLPMKSVLERAFDLLEAHSAALVEQYGWEAQLEFASFGVTEIIFSNDTLSFTLTLPKENSFARYLDVFANSVFFTVDDKVARYEGTPNGDYVNYPVILHYRGRDVSTDDDTTK